MAKNEKTKRKKFSFYWLCGKIGDILFIPILILSLFSSVSMLASRQQNKPTAILGYSLVNILSGSMTDAGFIKGDTVFTQKTAPEKVKLGDILAFYNYRDNLDRSTKKTIVLELKDYSYSKETGLNLSEENIKIGIDINSVSREERVDEKTIEDAQKAKSKIYFHQVIGIYLDEFGNVFYKTKGTNNSAPDSYIRSDFVVGKYVNTPTFLRDTMSFCASGTGMIILVCLPLSILVLLQCFSLIKQIEVMNYEKQLINGKKRFDDEDLNKDFDGNEMETYNKVYLYFLTEDVKRPQVCKFMWSDILDKEKPSKKEQKLIELLNNANQSLNNSKKDYWQTWIDGTKGYTKRKIKNYYEEDSLYSIMSSKVSKGSDSISSSATKDQSKQTTVKEDLTKETLNENTKQQILKTIEKTTTKSSSNKTTKQSSVNVKTSTPAKSITVKTTDKKENTPVVTPKIKVKTETQQVLKEETSKVKQPLKKQPAVKVKINKQEKEQNVMKKATTSSKTKVETMPKQPTKKQPQPTTINKEQKNTLKEKNNTTKSLSIKTKQKLIAPEKTTQKMTATKPTKKETTVQSKSIKSTTIKKPASRIKKSKN